MCEVLLASVLVRVFGGFFFRNDLKRLKMTSENRKVTLNGNFHACFKGYFWSALFTLTLRKIRITFKVKSLKRCMGVLVRLSPSTVRRAIGKADGP